MIWIAVIALAIGAAVMDGSHTGFSRLLKMAASTGVILVLAFGVPEVSPYAWMILAALIASWIGDLALSFSGRTAFVVGLVAFAAAHMFYSAAFVVRSPVVLVVLVPAVAVIGLMGWRIFVWLSPHAPEELMYPLMGYITIISAMVVLSFATQAVTLDIRIPLGAVVFAASDVFVARQRFVSSSRWNRLIGLPMYLAAQLLFVASV